jgi:hypothetical protein
MSSRACAVLFLFAAFVLSGCGPSLDEQLKLAEAKHRIAVEKQQQLQSRVDEHMKAVVQVQCLAATGTSSEMLKIEIEGISEMLRITGDADEAAKKQAEVSELVKRVSDFEERLAEKGTPEYERFQARMAEFEPYRELERQKAVVEQAQQELESIREKISSS